MLIRKVNSWPLAPDLNGFSEFERLQRDLSLFLNGRQTQREMGPPAGVFPLLHVTHDHNNFYIRSEVPGMTLDKLDLSVTGRTVSIAGERTIPSEKDRVMYHRQEREAGKFRRQFNLPMDVKSDQVQAKYRHGMLMIVLPKAESGKPRKITING